MKAADLFEAARRLPPGEQSAYVSSKLPEVLSDTKIAIWEPVSAGRRPTDLVLIGLAPYSLPDLQLVDAVAQSLGAGAAAPDVQVFNILTCKSMQDIKLRIPGVGKVYQTPVVGIWERGTLVKTAKGAEAARLLIERFKLKM